MARKAPEPDEHAAEAERLRLLPRDEQLAIVAWHRDIAHTAAHKSDREAAQARADALDRLLRLKRPEKNL